MTRHPSIAALVALVLASFSSVAVAADERAVYLKHGCWQCHGTEGQGTIVGPRLAPNPFPYEAFSAFVRNTSREMPPYREAVLSDADLMAIHTYLKSRPAGVDVKKSFEP